MNLREKAEEDLPNDPVLKTLDVPSDHVIDLGAPRGKLALILDEIVDGLGAQLADVVDRLLEGLAVEDHEDDNHVVGVTAGLLNVVREDVL